MLINTNNIWPANIFANNRIAKLNGLIIKEKNSITKIKIKSDLGTSSGSTILYKYTLYNKKPIIIKEKKPLKAKKIVTNNCAVIDCP